MSRSATTTAVVMTVILAALLAAAAEVLRLGEVWPALVALAVGLTAAPSLGRAGSFLLGICAGWIVFAARATIIPDIASGRGVALALGVAVVGAAAIATADRLPFWIGLAGIATFVGTYGPTYADEPTRFLGQSAIAFTQVFLAAAIGLLLAAVIGAARVALTPPSRGAHAGDPDDPGPPDRGARAREPRVQGTRDRGEHEEVDA